MSARQSSSSNNERASAERLFRQAKYSAVTQLCLTVFLATAASAAEKTNVPWLPRTNLLVSVTSAGEIVPVRSVEDWQQRRHSILRGMLEVMGPLPGNAKRCPLEIRVEEDIDCGDYRRQLISYSSEPGSRVPAYLLIPPGSNTTNFPAILALHQTHALGQKVVVGLGKSTNDEYGVELVRRGFVVIAPPYPLLANYHPDLKALGYASGTMKAIWDNIRALDLLSSLPFVRTNGFGAIGHSLGGHNSVYTAAFDERIKVVASSCGLDSFLDYMNGNIKGWTSTRYMPRLLNYSLEQIPFDFHEIVALLAPRTCFISAPVGDTNFNWDRVDRIAAAARPVYELHGVPSNLIVDHPDCGHTFPSPMRQKAYELFDRVLRE